jgi:hypothetical protein
MNLIASIFRRAPLDESQGTQSLSPGRYFIDSASDELFSSEGFNEAFSALPHEAIQEVLDSGRGQTMVSFRFHSPFTAPHETLLKTGFFWELPEGVTLRSAQEKLYGEHYSKPQGFWEYLAAEHPDLLEVSKNVAEGVDETVTAIAKKGKELTTTIVIIAASIVAVLVAIKLTRK